MLNIRTLVLSVILVAALLLTVGLLTAGTEVVSNASSNPGGVSAVEEEPADLNSVLSAPSYRSQFGECYDVSIQDVAACHGAGQRSAQPERPSLDECYDVSIWDLPACRNASQAPVP